MNRCKEFSQSYFNSANEANPEGELALTTLVANLIEVATHHANSLGFGNTAMEEHHAGWVLSRLTVDMKYYPRVNTDYSIITWVESWNRFFSIRDFEIRDASDVICGYARSVWMVLNTETHENYGTTHLKFSPDLISDRECPIKTQERHRPIFPTDSEHPANALIASAPTTQYTFKYNDIDFYRHVNTVKYVMLLLNRYSLEDFDLNMPQRLELSFLHEGKYGETVDIHRYDPEPLSSSFSVSREGDPESAILFGRLRLQPRHDRD